MSHPKGADGREVRALPRRPRLVRDLRISVLREGLGVDIRGAGAPMLFRGPHCADAFFFLKAALDGKEEIVRIMENRPRDLPPAAVLRMLELLGERGLLREGADGPGVPRDGLDHPPDAGSCRQALFWDRYAGVPGASARTAEPTRQIADTRVLLLGTGFFGSKTADLLLRSGVRLRVVAWDDLEVLPQLVTDEVEATLLATRSAPEAVSELARCLRETDLLVTATRNAPAVLFAGINRLCAEQRTPWLRADDAAGTYDLGPMVSPGSSACFCCMELRQASSHPLAVEERLAQEVLEQPRPAGLTRPLGESVAAASLGAGLVALEVLRWATGLLPSLRDRVLSVDPVGGGWGTDELLPVATCPDCAVAQDEDLK